MADTMTTEKAKRRFAEMISLYGVQWGASVPREAYEELAALNKVLSEDDRRSAMREIVRDGPSQNMGLKGAKTKGGKRISSLFSFRWPQLR